MFPRLLLFAAVSLSLSLLDGSCFAYFGVSVPELRVSVVVCVPVAHPPAIFAFGAFRSLFPY